MRLAPLALLVTLGLALPAAAQQDPAQVEPQPQEPTQVAPEQQPLEPQQLEIGEPPPSPVFGFIGGGASFPMSDAGDRFDTGYAFHGGLGFNVNRYLGVQGEAFWSRYDVKGSALNATDLDANHRMQYGALDLVLNGVRSGPFTAYVLAGGGIYYRRVELTTFLGTAAVPVCDPWLYYCYTDVVPVEGVLGSRSSTDFGLNGGLGVSLKVASGLRIYLEGRYHYIFGPEFTNAGNSQRANGQYIPVMLGLRFE